MSPSSGVLPISGSPLANIFRPDPFWLDVVMWSVIFDWILGGFRCLCERLDESEEPGEIRLTDVLLTSADCSSVPIELLQLILIAVFWHFRQNRKSRF